MTITPNKQDESPQTLEEAKTVVSEALKGNNLEALIELFNNWCRQNDIEPQSADDLLSADKRGKISLSRGQREFIIAFITVWEGFDQ